MNHGSTSSTLFWLVIAIQAVCPSVHALPTVCNYTYPHITKESGPVNITILTPKEPNEIGIHQRNESYLIRDGMCVDTLSMKPSFPCPYVCELHFCFLTIQLADISGVDAIYLYSHSYEHIGGVYRKEGMYARERYFDLQEPVVYCVNISDVEITWRVRKPEGVSAMSCAYRGPFDIRYVDLEETTEPQNVTMTASFKNEVFKGFTCWINVESISVAVERFVLWLDVAYFEKAGQTQSRFVGSEETGTEFSWNFVISTPDQAHNFTCLSHDGVKCTGVTEVQEPGKCEIEITETGMKYAITTSIAVNDFAAYDCYIGEEESAQSVYKLGSHESKRVTAQLIEAKIALNLNGEHVALNDLGTHYLWLQNVQIEDVKCEKHENKFTCHLSPDNLKIYWIVANGDLHSMIDELSVNETLRFTGSFGNCITGGFFVKVDGDERDVGYINVIHYRQDRLDTLAMLSDFLLSVFSYEC